MRVSLKSVSGVDSVVVSLEKGLAAVKMKSGNVATFRQLNDAITKNGFTMKQSIAMIAGKVIIANGKSMLQISGSNEILQLTPESASVASAVAFKGKFVVVTGSIPEPAKGKAPDSMRYRSISEEQQK